MRSRSAIVTMTSGIAALRNHLKRMLALVHRADDCVDRRRGGHRTRVTARGLILIYSLMQLGLAVRALPGRLWGRELRLRGRHVGIRSPRSPCCVMPARWQSADGRLHGEVLAFRRRIEAKY